MTVVPKQARVRSNVGAVPAGAPRLRRAARGVLAVVVAGATLAACAGADGVGVSVGDCLDPGEGDAVAAEAVIPCDEPHVAEVFAVLSLADDDAAYPGEDDAFVDGEDLCLEVFADYVGSAYADSQWFIRPSVPTAQEWESGRRDVACLLTTTEREPVTGSARSSGT